MAMAAQSDVGELRRVLADIRVRAHTDPESTGKRRKRTRASLEDVAAAQFVSVMAADDHARIVEANAAACALSGFTRAELVQMRVDDLFPEHPERFSRAWRRFVASGAFAGACRLRQRSGLLVTVECVASANVIAGVHVATLASRRLLQSLS
jgi:PAS domain S-box-containing protein